MNDRQQTLTSMPGDFYWAPRCHLDKLPTGLFLHGQQLASLQERVDGSWVAHLRIEAKPFGKVVFKDCSSFEAGRRGCEAWALRHETALRERVDAKLQWIQDNVSLRPPGGRRMDLEKLDRRAIQRAKGPEARA